jgi:hypothetical protein
MTGIAQAQIFVFAPDGGSDAAATTSNCHSERLTFRSAVALIDSARRQLIVVERHGQAQIIASAPGYAAGVRPRKAVSRSLGVAVAAMVTGAANRGCRPGAGGQQRGYHQQVSSQDARDRLALPARLGYVPPVHGELEGCRGGHDAGRQRAAADVDDLALVARASPGVKQLAGTITEGPGGISRQVIVRGGGVQAKVSGFDTLTESGQGFAGMP